MSDSINTKNPQRHSVLLNKPLMYGVIFGLFVFGALLAGLFPKAILFLVIGLAATAVAALFISRPRWLVYTLAFLLAFQISVDAFLGAMISPQIVVITAFAAPFLLLLLENRIGRLLTTPYLWLWLLYVGIGTLAVARGPSVSTGFQGIWALYRLVWSAPIAYLVTYVFLKTPKQINQALSWLSIGATVSSIVAIVQVATDGRLLSGLTTNYKYLGLFPSLPAETTSAFSEGTARKLFLAGTNLFRAHGTFLAVNALGVFLATTIFITWGLFSSAKGKKRWFYFLGLILQGIAIIVTFSRSAWLGVALGIAIIVLWKFQHILRSKRTLLNLTFAALAGLILITIIFLRVPTVAEHFTTLFSPQEVSEVKWRINIWNYVLEKVKENPLLGTGKTYIPTDEADIPGRAEGYSSHNLLMDIMYQRGLVSLTIYIGFWLIFFMNSLKLLKQKKTHKIYHNMYLGLVAAGFAYLVSGIGTPTMIYYNLAVLFWTIMGVNFSLTRGISLYKNKP